MANLMFYVLNSERLKTNKNTCILVGGYTIYYLLNPNIHFDHTDHYNVRAVHWNNALNTLQPGLEVVCLYNIQNFHSCRVYCKTVVT